MTHASAPLSGVRVADFSVHAAGPFAGMILASLGADVIKVESEARLDITRRPHAMYGKPPSSFEQVNASKRSVTLNLKEVRALELAHDLVRISDVVLENFRPGVMDRLGLGYPQLREISPTSSWCPCRPTGRPAQRRATPATRPCSPPWVGWAT